MGLLVAGGIALALVAAAALLGPALVGMAAGAAGRALGYELRYDDLRVTPGRLTFVHPEVRSLRDEPVLTAERVELAYSIRDMFGGPYLYGITGVVLEGPKLTILHHRDGTYNITLPPAAGAPNAQPFVLPRLQVAIRNGWVGLTDDTRVFAHSRRFSLEAVELSAGLRPRERSEFELTFSLAEAGGTFPFAGRGTLDEQRGYELSRITARRVAIAPLLDYAVNSTALHFADGVLGDVDARAYGLPDRNGTMQRHLSLAAGLEGLRAYLGGLAKPLRDGRGTVRYDDGGIALPGIDGSIAGVPVRLAGAVYDLFGVPAGPAVRLGIAGRGGVRDLLTLNEGARSLPVSGSLGFKLLVEGSAAAPTTFASFDSPRLAYGTIPVDAPSGLVALHGQGITVLRSALRYAGIGAGVRGTVLLEKHTGIELVETVAAPARRLPYAAALLGDMRVEGTAVTTGTDADLLTSGVVGGRGAAESFAGTFALDGRGIGSLGPFALDGPGSRSLYARVALDRPHFSGGSAFISARDFGFSTAGPQPELPGVVLPSLPRADGTLDAGAVAAFAGKHFSSGGSAHVSGAHVLGYPVDDITARFAVGDPAGVALEARYRGPLAALAAAAGVTLAARGNADIPIRVVARGLDWPPADVLVQTQGARFTDASVGGVALESLDATIVRRPDRLDVYAARARLAGRDVVAQGSFGAGGTVAVSASGIDLARLQGLGLPVRAGTLTALATIGGTAAAPNVRGGVAAAGVRSADPRFANVPVSGSAGLSFRGETLTLDDGQVQAGSALTATLDGRIAGLRGEPRNAAYAFDTRVRQADVATLARVARVRLPYPEGTLEADLHVAGRGASPRVNGTLALPEGSLNGLGFRDASVVLSGSGGAVQARSGRVTVGSSTVAFTADLSRARQSATLDAPRVDLSDFNNYFDRGDTLGGTGSIALSASSSANAFATSGRIRLADTRLHRFDVGASRAEWDTTGRTLRANASLGGSSGRVALAGTLTEPATDPLRDPLRRSYLNLNAAAHGIDLGTWLPVAGVQAAVEGSVDATATARGSYPDLTFAGRISLSNGLLQRVSVRSASIGFTAARGQASIAEADFAIDNLTAQATGSVGLRPAGPVDVTVVARTADAGALAKTLTGKIYDAAGAVVTTLHVTGTLQHPAFDDTLDADAVRYGRYTLPHAHTEVSVTRTRATLRRAQFDLTGGRLLATGFVPLQRQPVPGIGPATAPLALDLTVDHVDLAQFAALLPEGTQLAGTLDGRVALGGSQADPGLSGALSLAGGSFAGPQERSKIADATAQLSFARRSLTISGASADAGGGKVSTNGRLTLGSLRDPARSATADLTLAADNATFDFPGYFKGRVLGNVTVKRSSGGPALVAGKLALSSARVPPAAILRGNPPPAETRAPALPVAFDLGIAVGNDARVQGGPVDIGGKGDLHLSGTLAAPAAGGSLTSTGGTVSFYRTFQIQFPSTVTFDPSNGIVPYVDATATTLVANPPTDVTLRVTGPATKLDVALASNPSYSREQILGLLVGAQALGAVSGLQPTTGGPQQNPFTALAAGQLGVLLTQNILQPLSSQLGSVLGLSNLSVGYDYGAGLTVGAQQKIFKNVSAVFAQTFSFPQRQTIGLVATPNAATAIQLTFFSQPTSNLFNAAQGAQTMLSTNAAVTAVQPSSGVTGFSLSFQRKF